MAIKRNKYNGWGTLIRSDARMSILAITYQNV